MLNPVFTTLIGATLIAQGIPSQNNNDAGISEYTRIDRFLADYTEPGTDHVNILKNASETLERVKPSLKKDQLRYWKTFVSLARLRDPNFRCTPDAVRLLEENVGYSYLDRKKKTDVTRPTQKVVQGFLIEHAEDCEIEYERKFKKIQLENMNSSLNIVGAVADKLRFYTKIYDIFRPNSPIEEKFISRFYSIKNAEFKKLISQVIHKDPELEPLKVLTGYKKNKRLTVADVDKSEIKRLVLSIPERCRIYMNLYEDVLKPALYDAGTYPVKRRYGDDMLSNGMFKYFCCQLLARVQSWTDYVDGVVERLPRMLRIHEPPKEFDPSRLEPDVAKNLFDIAKKIRSNH